MASSDDELYLTEDDERNTRDAIEESEEERRKAKETSITGLWNQLHTRLSLRQKAVPSPIATTLSKSSSTAHNAVHHSPPNPRPSYFRFLDLPDELQLHILSYSFQPRVCEIKDPDDEDKIRYRHSPKHTSYASPYIPLADVNRKFRAMTYEFHPYCFDYEWHGSKSRYPIRFNVKMDVLVMPQWLLEKDGFEMPNLSKVKDLIITCISPRPNPLGITRLSQLSSDAAIQFIHAGIWKYDSPSYSFLKGKDSEDRLITSKGPYWADDAWTASRTRRGLRQLRQSTDSPVPFVAAARITSMRHSDRQTGWTYKMAKQWEYRKAVKRFEKVEREIEKEVRRRRNLFALQMVAEEQ